MFIAGCRFHLHGDVASAPGKRLAEQCSRTVVDYVFTSIIACHYITAVADEIAMPAKLIDRQERVEPTRVF